MFGAKTTATGFSFGSTTAPAATAAPSAGSGFSFGATAPATTSAASTGFSFKPATANTGILGTAPTATPAATPAAATSSSGFSFGAGGTPATATVQPLPSTGLGLGGGFGSSTPTATVAASINSTGFTGFTGLTPASSNVAAAAPLTLGGSLLGGSASLSLSTTTATTSTTGLNIGLGGANPPSIDAGINNGGIKPDGKTTKETMLPQDIVGSVYVVEALIKSETGACEENIRHTDAAFHKVLKTAGEMQKGLTEISSEYLQLHSSAGNLKQEVLKSAEHVEMSRRTKETPMALQGENKAPEEFFIALVRSFEQEMLYCRTKIEEVKQCMQAACNPCETAEDIKEVLQREHETMKVLAGDLYNKHAQLVELSQRLNTRSRPAQEAFFKALPMAGNCSQDSAIVRALGSGGSGLQSYQEQEQRAKAIGTAPPTLPLAQAQLPSLFGNTANTSMFNAGTTLTANNNQFKMTANNTFGNKTLFGNNTTGFGNTSTGFSGFGNTSSFGNTSGTGFGTNTSTPFGVSSPFTVKPFGS
ncbi:unnamed protein product [Meganyctiphanes norvegica]|uniref:Nucleoporin p58/p45 n=1 Tax=Meganyctiphanes norvegica TaxID=48144 RepID=A0AAV2PWM9_MEGNR